MKVKDHYLGQRSFSRSSPLNPAKWLYHCRVRKCEGYCSQKIKFEVVCKTPKLQDCTWQNTQKNVKRKFVEKIQGPQLIKKYFYKVSGKYVGIKGNISI